MAFHGDSIFWVEVDKIVANPFQPRREFDEDKLQELAESVRMYGILQPLTVTRKEIERDDGAFYTEYELIAGERRLRASKLAGLQQVPVIIRDGDSNEQEKLELAIIENLQREDLNAVDRALAFKQLAESFNLSHAKVAGKVGRSREYVSNTLRLLLLPDHMLDSLKRGDISEGHARTLLMLSDRPDELETVYREILLKKMSVREVERIVRKIAKDKVRSQKYKDMDPSLIEYEKKFTETLGTRVQIAKTEFGGKLTIDYFSEDDLNKLLDLIQHTNGDIEAVKQAADQMVKDNAAGEVVPSNTEQLSEHTPLNVDSEVPKDYENSESESVTPASLGADSPIPPTTAMTSENSEESREEDKPEEEAVSSDIKAQPNEVPSNDVAEEAKKEDLAVPQSMESFIPAFNEPENYDLDKREDEVKEEPQELPKEDSETEEDPWEVYKKEKAKAGDESDLYSIRNFNV